MTTLTSPKPRFIHAAILLVSSAALYGIVSVLPLVRDQARRAAAIVKKPIRMVELEEMPAAP